MLKPLIACAALAAALIQPATAAPITEGGGVLWTRNCDGLTLPVPAGWVLDNETARAQGIDMLFYPARKPANKERLYIWVQPSIRHRPDQTVTVDALLADSLTEARKADNTVAQRVLSRSPITPGRFGTTLVSLTLPQRKMYEQIAYLEDEQAIFAVILTASSPELLAANAPVLDTLVDKARFWHLNSSPPCQLPQPR